jgi:DNA-dependent RNA polymerase auxiliary subunit epsilon
MKKYIVDFTEKAMVRRTTQCLVEAENEEEAEKKVRDGDYEFIDSWDEDDMGADIVSVDSIVEDTDEED